MSDIRPSSLSEIRSLASHMAQHPADAMALASQLNDAIRRLPPEHAQLLTSPHWKRGTLWTLVAQFENIELTEVNETPPQNIRLPRDMWIRGVNACVIVEWPLVGLTTSGFFQQQARNNRWAVEVNWRVDARQGFVSSGQSEILESAAAVTGDGECSVPLDWRLQKDQTIEVRLRSSLTDVYAFPDDAADSPERIRWAVVSFWGEDTQQASVR